MDRSKQLTNLNMLAGRATEEEPKRTPEMNEKRPISICLNDQNRRLCIAALPCIVMIVAMVGESLLSLIVVGSAVSYLLSVLGEQRKSVVVFLLCFLMSQMTVLYTIFPLIWVSIVNIFFVALVNVFLILTGSWFIVQFSSFKMEEPEMSKLIEMALFSVYPGVCVLLLSWFSMLILPLSLLPLIVMSLGFIILQLFMVPSVPFSVSSKDCDRILSEPILIAMALTYCCLPSALHFGLALSYHGTDGILQIKYCVEAVFLLNACLFLTTFLNLRQCFEFLGWSYSMLLRVRAGSGTFVTLLCYPVLQSHGMTSHFLPWLPLGIGGHAIYGVVLKHRKVKMASLAGLASLLCLYVLWMMHLPWTLNYYFADNIHLTTFNVLLFINALLCLGSLYSATYSIDYLPVILMLQGIIFSCSELLLRANDLYPSSLMMLTAAIAVYMLCRLFYTTGKLMSSAPCFAISVHVTKMLHVLLPGTGQQSHVLNILQLFALCLVIINILAMNMQQSLDVKVLVSLGVALLVNTDTLLIPLCQQLMQGSCAATNLLGLYVIVYGAVTFAIIYFRHEALEGMWLKLSITAVLAGSTLLVMQPQLTLKWASLLHWGQYCSVILLAIITQFDSIKMPTIFGISSFVGAFAAFRIWELWYESETGLILITFGVLCGSLVHLGLVLFKSQRTAELEILAAKISAVVGVSCLLTVAADLALMPAQAVLSQRPVWPVVTAVTLIVGIIMKRYLTLEKSQRAIPLMDNEKRINVLPYVGNTNIVVGFLMLCALSPATGVLHDVWCCGATLVLLCLHKDDWLLRSLQHDNQAVPSVMASLILIFSISIGRSDLWLPESTLDFLRSIIELILIVITSPVYVVLWGVMYRREIIWSEMVVVLLMPLNSILLLLASSYTCRILALSGLTSGIWMMVQRLPLLPKGPH